MSDKTFTPGRAAIPVAGFSFPAHHVSNRGGVFNLPAVPVLAEPCVPYNRHGEARESITAVTPCPMTKLLIGNSCGGGQFTFYCRQLQARIPSGPTTTEPTDFGGSIVGSGILLTAAKNEN